MAAAAVEAMAVIKAEEEEAAARSDMSDDDDSCSDGSNSDADEVAAPLNDDDTDDDDEEGVDEHTRKVRADGRAARRAAAADAAAKAAEKEAAAAAAAATAAAAESAKFLAPVVTAYRGGVTAVAPSPSLAAASDPLVLLLDASTSMRKVDLDTLAEALTRLFTYLAATARRVTIIIFHDEAVVVHPREERVFPIMRCEMHSAAPLRTEEVMSATLAELRTACALPIATANVAFLVRAYTNAIRGGSSDAVHHTWITSTLRLAAALLRNQTTRQDVGAVLLVCDGGEFYGRDAAGRQGFLEAPAIVSRLLPAYATLPCPTTVSCLALGPEAELDTLASIAYAFDGVLAYAPSAAELGGALADVMRLLDRRPQPLLVRGGDGGAVHDWPMCAAVAAAKTQLSAAVCAALGTDGDARSLGCMTAGALVAAPSAAVTVLVDTDEVGAVDGGDLPPQLRQLLDTATAAKAALVALWPLLSWRRKVVAAADTPALTALLAAAADDAAARGLLTPLVATLRAVVAARRGDGSNGGAAAVRAAVPRLLRLAYHPFSTRVDVRPAHADAFDALPVESSIVQGRHDFEEDFPRWVAANAKRAALYKCALLGDAQDLLGVTVCEAPAAPPPRLLWAHKAEVKWEEEKEDDGAKPTLPPIMLAPPLDFAAPRCGEFVGLEAHAVACVRKPWAAADITPVLADGSDGALAGTVLAYEVGGARVPIGSRCGRELTAVLRAAAVPPLPPTLLPLFQRLEEAMNPYTSIAASKRLAALANGGVEDAWQDKLLPVKVYGSTLAAWLHAAADGTPYAAPHLPPAHVVEELVRTLALTVDGMLASDVYARFVCGRAPLPKESKDKDKKTVAPPPDMRAAATSPWRDVDVAGDLPALGLVLALYRNASEFARAKGAAVRDYVAKEEVRRARAAVDEVHTEVERRLASTLAARARRGLSVPYRTRDLTQYRNIIRRDLLAERAKAAELEGAALDEKEKKAALTKEIVNNLPPDLAVGPFIDYDKYRIASFVSDAVPVIAAEAVRRGASAEYAARLAHKLTALYEMADALVVTNSADKDALWRVFST